MFEVFLKGKAKKIPSFSLRDPVYETYLVGREIRLLQSIERGFVRRCLFIDVDGVLFCGTELSTWISTSAIS